MPPMLLRNLRLSYPSAPVRSFDTASIPDRFNILIQTYLAVDIFNDRLQDLPQQFQNPPPRTKNIFHAVKNS